MSSATFDSARRALDLLLRAQARSPRPLRLRPLATEWGVSWKSVRRVVAVAVEQAEEGEVGRLVREGAGEKATVTWRPDPVRSDPVMRAAVLLAALGPWKAVGVEDVAATLRARIAESVEGSGAAAHQRLSDLERRGFYYQPIPPRRRLDPDTLNEVLAALVYGRALVVEHYRGIKREHTGLVLEPWTLVHAMDGLYLVALARGAQSPRLWALHRMAVVSWLRDQPVEVPEDYDPEELLGHGYGPFIGQPGRTVLRVPAKEVPWVLESPLPGQVGEPELLPGGDVRVVIDVGMQPGLRLWARWMGVEVEEARALE